MAINNHGFDGDKNIYDLADILNRLEALESSSGVISFDKVFPIGSIYMTIDSSFNPATNFGGTWERFAEGRTIFGVKSGDSDFFTASNNGGAKTKNFTVAGSISGTKLNINHLPAHSHNMNHNHAIEYNGSRGSDTDKNIYVDYQDNPSGNWEINTWIADDTYAASPVNGKLNKRRVDSLEGAGRLLTNIPSNTLTGSVGEGAAHGHTFNGANTSINVLPPYTTCYIWKRTG